MRKNIIIIILTLTLAVVTFNYINTRYRISVLQKQLNEQNTDTKSRFTFYEYEDSKFYYLLSDDNKLYIGFTYDEQGLKETFGVADDLSGKKFGFNFYEGEWLTSFHYEDDRYTIANNLYQPNLWDNPEKFIERLERIYGIETIYTLFSNGTTDIKIRSE